MGKQIGQLDLFDDRSSVQSRNQQGQRIDLPGADIVYFPRMLQTPEAENLFSYLLNEVQWQQPEVTLYGRRCRIPRLVAWYGDAGAVYSYSSLRHLPLPWMEPLLDLKARVEAISATRFNSVLLNLYRNEKDSVGRHSDNEQELGEFPVIASVSLGATRKFRFCSVSPRARLNHDIDLENGSLLLMQGATQRNWKHCIPRSTHPTGSRINLTFRLIMT